MLRMRTETLPVAEYCGADLTKDAVWERQVCSPRGDPRAGSLRCEGAEQMSTALLWLHEAVHALATDVWCGLAGYRCVVLRGHPVHHGRWPIPMDPGEKLPDT